MRVLLVFSALVVMVSASCHDAPDCGNLDWCNPKDPAHPFYKCIKALNPRIKDEIIRQCKALKTSEEIKALYDNIKLICDQKHLEVGECCEVCDFEGQECFDEMNELMQKCVMTDCENAEGDPDALDDLLENLNLICEVKEKEALELNDCCDSCDFSDQDCYEAMAPLMQKKIRMDCCDVLGTAGYQELLDNLNLLCESKGEADLFDPCDEVCNRADLCVVFVVDSSGSIDPPDWITSVEFVEQFIAAFTGNIAPDKTRIGIIQYADTILIKKSLCLGTSEAVLEAAADDMKGSQSAAGEFTHTGTAILEMVDEFDECCKDMGKEKYAIVLTDGLANGGATVPDAMGNVPADVNTIAIGVGFDTGDAELLQIAKGDAARRLHVNNAGELAGLISELLALLEC